MTRIAQIRWWMSSRGSLAAARGTLRSGLLLTAVCWPVGQARGWWQTPPMLPSPTAEAEAEEYSTWFEQVSAPLRRHDLKRESAASCAAAACHGGPQPGVADPLAPVGSEYGLWLAHDPHARSWKTVCGDAGVRMMRNLKIMVADEIVDHQAYQNCLACHNPTPLTAAVPGASGGEQPGSGEGVGCSGCHGPSQNWRKDHVRIRWEDLTSAQLGLVPTENLLARARMCAGCHVGDRDRDMNHDLIAAGHPALYFEFTTYHQRLPKHWREPERSEHADFESQLWLAGQLASLDASLDLLEARASGQGCVSTWPEFSSDACSSCHQRLTPPATPLSAGSAGNTGRFSRWGVWGVELLADSVVREQPQLVDQGTRHELKTLLQLMDHPVAPDPERARQQSRRARFAIDQCLTQVGWEEAFAGFSSARLERELASLADRPQRLSGWESAGQFYLAAVASRGAWRAPRQAKLERDAGALRDVLRVPPYLASPAPVTVHPDEPRRRAQRLAETLQAGTPLQASGTDRATKGQASHP